MRTSHEDSIVAAQEQTDPFPIEAEERIAIREQHSLPWSILLHLLPGIIIFALFLLIASPLQAAGFPPFSFTAMLIGVVVLGGTLGELLYQGRKRNGRLSLKGIVLYHKPLPWWQYIVFALIFNVYAIIVIILLGPLLNAMTSAFTWWPGYGLRLDSGHYADGILLISSIIYFLVNGFIAPIIEELYFRGYLMPRLARFRAWTPFLSMTLFLLYHFWQPWNIVVYMLALWPLAYLTWRKRNVYLAIVLHSSLNVIPMLLQLPILFAVAGRVFGLHS